jgi:hypothetical protein
MRYSHFPEKKGIKNFKKTCVKKIQKLITKQHHNALLFLKKQTEYET